MRLVPTRRSPSSAPRETRTPSRSRWAAIGAAVAVTIGGGGILTTSASIGSGERGVYVPIAPCRLFDTRPGSDNVGPRNTPLGPGDTFTASVRGTNGNCTIPADAVGLTMNVAIINPSSASFLTVFPADVTRPLAANANWTAGQPPLSNAVTADISGDGKIAFYNLAGTVDVAADIVGYYVDHTHDDRYYTKTETDTRYITPTAANTLALRGSTRVNIASTAAAGVYSSVAIGTDGNPVIAHYDNSNGDLEVTKCTNPTCTGAATTTPIDNAGNVGIYTSIAIGTDGNPIISYQDASNNDLKVAKCTNPTCTAATLTPIDTAGSVGSHTSITIGTDANPIISYTDTGNGNLKTAKCTNPACTAATITPIDTVGDVGYYTSIAIGTDGNPIISYFDNTDDDLKTAKCTNTSCTGTATITPIDTTDNVGYFTSLAIGTDGNPIISYYDTTNDDLKTAKCTNPTCTGAATITTIDTAGDVGWDTSIQITADGNPVIAYADGANNDVKYASCGNAACTGASSITTLHTNAAAGTQTSLRITPDGRPVITNYDAANSDLHISTCATTTCIG